MKRWYVVVTFIAAHAILIQHNANAQRQPFDWPFGDGDRVVIGDMLLRFDGPDTESRYNYFDTLFSKILTVHAYPDIELLTADHERNGYLYDAGITYTGNFALIDCLNSEVAEFFPLAPHQDTVWLHKLGYGDAAPGKFRYCTNFVEFDTTIYEETVHAFSADIYALDHTPVYRIAIADKYWLLMLETPDQRTSTLNRFKIGSRLKNIGPYTFDFPLICSSLKYTYLKEVVVGPGGETINVAPTPVVIHDTTYYLGIPELFPGYKFSYPLRSQGGNLYVRENGKERMYTPPQLYLGDSSYTGEFMGGEWVVQVDSGNYMGERKIFTFVQEYPRNFDNMPQLRRFASKLGFWDATFQDVFTYTKFTLQQFTPCSTDTRVDRPETPDEMSISVYPNPVSLRQNSIVTISLVSPVRSSAVLSIHDAIGRQVFTSNFESLVSDYPISVPLKNLLPGKYYISLDGKGIHANGSFTVLK